MPELLQDLMTIRIYNIERGTGMQFVFNKTSGFLEKSEVRNYRPHLGEDYAMPLNTELRSVGSGEVSRVVDFGDRALGKGVYVRLENGETAIYGHLNKISVEVGDKVETGSLLGYSGSSGFSTGPHLHFAVKSAEGEFINPSKYEVAIQSLSGQPGPVDSIVQTLEPNSMQASLDQFMSQLSQWNTTVPNSLLEFMNSGSPF